MANANEKNLFSDDAIRAYLNDSLSDPIVQQIESVLRQESVDSNRLIEQIQKIASESPVGTHSIGEIWRRNRLSCPKREDLSRYLLGAIGEEEKEFIRIHLQSVQCVACQANLDDLSAIQRQLDEQSKTIQSDRSTQERRSKYFQSSVGRLPRLPRDHD
jgi:hypothetical protein